MKRTKNVGGDRTDRTTANVDVVISNAALATFRVGFHDDYSDTGIPQTTNYTYQTVASAAIGLPANLQGPTGTRNTPRAQITDFDTTTRTLFNADYNHTFESIGWHTLKGGFGYQHTLNDVNSPYPGGYVDIFWGSTLPSGRSGDRQGRLRLLRRQRPRHLRQGRRGHPLALRSGPVAGWRPADVESSGSARRTRTSLPTSTEVRRRTSSNSGGARRSRRASDSATT